MLKNTNIKKNYRNVVFIIAGERDIHNPECVPLEIINSWLKEGCVEWWGHCKNMPEIFSKINIVCFPSYREGLPKVLLEASACCRPIVTFDVPGCREVVIDGFNGYLAPFGDINKIEVSIIKLINSSKLRKEMGRNGRKKIIEEFSSVKINNQTIQIWNELNKNNDKKNN